MQYSRFTLIFTLTLSFLPCFLKGLPLDFNDAGDFYHELGSLGMWAMFQVVSLNKEAVEILAQLLSSEIFNIRHHYNLHCSLIEEGRLSTLLYLIHDREDLERHLLGPACLSPAIIKAREKYRMWPLYGVPLLIEGFKPDNITTENIREILDVALKYPTEWQSAKWIQSVDWNEMNDFRFWRMIPPVENGDNQGLYQYLKKALVQISNKPTCQDLEELLMKSIRMLKFKHDWRKDLKEDGLDMDTLQVKFSLLQDSWSVKVIAFLKGMYSEKSWDIISELGKSDLLELALWRDANIDGITATNDIFELFTISFRLAVTSKREMFTLTFKRFIEDVTDWPRVRPLVLAGAFDQGVFDFANSRLFKKYSKAILENPNALPVLPHVLLEDSADFKVHQYSIKMRTRPLRDDFALLDADPSLSLQVYTDLLHEEWKGRMDEWPGYVAAHEQVKDRVRGIFKPSKDNDGTYDPKVDSNRRRDLWFSAFNSILFEIQYGIRSSAIPSMCFLRALAYYQGVVSAERGINWSELRESVGEGCTFPESEQERIRYGTALDGALWQFSYRTLALPLAHPNLMQALIRGDYL